MATGDGRVRDGWVVWTGARAERIWDYMATEEARLCVVLRLVLLCVCLVVINSISLQGMASIWYNLILVLNYRYSNHIIYNTHKSSYRKEMWDDLIRFDSFDLYINDGPRTNHNIVGVCLLG